MHTLGHAGMQMHTHGHHAAQAAVALPGSMPELGAMTVCDRGCAHDPGSPPYGGMSGWSICLAVLGAFAALLLLATLVAGSRRGRPAAPDVGWWAGVSRGPPVSPAGLPMVAVSVLRI
jgi:hypothetical protein